MAFSNGQLVNASDLNNFSVTSVTTSAGVAVGSTLTVGTTATVTGTLGVTGATTLTGALTANGDVNLGNASADTVTVTGTVVGAPLKTYTETSTAASIATGAVTYDCSLGTYFTTALNAACTVTISNAPASGRALGITIIFTADGTVRAITWPASVVWANGVAPTMTGTNNKRDIITLLTINGGTTWFGIVVGQNY